MFRSSLPEQDRQVQIYIPGKIAERLQLRTYDSTAVTITSYEVLVADNTHTHTQPCSQSHAQLFVACSTVKRGGPGTFPHMSMTNRKTAKFSEQERYVLRVIRPSTCSMLGEYDSRPPLARYVWYLTWYLCSSCCSETHVHPRSFRSFYHLSTLDITHMRKCTRPSPHYRTASVKKLGMGLGMRLTHTNTQTHTHSSSCIACKE